MPVEPPVSSPRDLAEAYARLAAAARPGPIAGGTDLMVALTGELGEPPDRILDLWRLDELRGIAIDGDAISLGALTTYTEIRRSALCREHLPVAGRGGRDDRCGPDPEPRDARREHRECLARRRHAAGPPRRRRRRSSSVRARGERTVAANDFWPAYRTTALAPDELLLRIRVPLLGRSRDALPQGRDAARPVDQQGRHGPRLARRVGRRAAGPSAPWTDVRLALGSVAATPIRAAATEAVLEGRPPTPETADLAAETLAGELQPIDDVRSTAEYRRLVAARVLHRLIREAGGW